jgi:hypothetical protein
MREVRQRCVLSADEVLETVLGAEGWRLAYSRGGEPRLVYEGDRASARRVRDGRPAAYTLRSVEQLRYDFENELAQLRGASA